ncbi:MAG: T9SS type A sorting domain-containing protein, partial [Calditrichia bacterium]|nr:T9SS type A sorting domain-containing protein [Calditrichia bacterium]
LFQNYPNPFNSTTNIQFNIAKPSKVKITIFDINGRKVKVLTNNKYSAGAHKISWTGKNLNGKNVASGVYFYRMEIYSNKKYTKIKKLILLK